MCNVTNTLDHRAFRFYIFGYIFGFVRSGNKQNFIYGNKRTQCILKWYYINGNLQEFGFLRGLYWTHTIPDFREWAKDQGLPNAEIAEKINSTVVALIIVRFKEIYFRGRAICFERSNVWVTEVKNMKVVIYIFFF